MFKDILKKLKKETNNQPERKRPLISSFGRREFINDLSPEGVNDLIERAGFPVGADTIIYDEELAARPCEQRVTILDAYPDIEERIQPIYDQLMEKGGLIVRGKMFHHGREYGDYVSVLSGGQIKPDEDTNPGTLSWALPVNEYVTSFTESGGYLYEEGVNQELDPLSGIFTHLMSVKDIENLISNNEEAYATKALEQVKSIAESDPNGEVMTIVHLFLSGSRARGHRVTTRFIYILPGELGRDFEKQLFDGPWLIEALSEKVVKDATQELLDESPSKYSFLDPYDKEDLSQTTMFEASQTGHIKLLVSFYNKD